MSLAVSLLAVFVVAAMMCGLAAQVLATRLGALTNSTGSRAAWIMAPVLAAVTLCVALVWPGLAQAVCHCVAHGLHHPHLCLGHPDYAAGAVLPALIIVVIWACLALPSLGRLLSSLWQTERWTRRAERAPVQVLDEVRFRLIDAPGLGAFTTGLFRPLIAIDVDLWCRLNEEERRAVLHHENAHRVRLDPLTVFVLRICATLAVLPDAAGLLRKWQAKAEDECDRHAAQTVAAPEAVASALLALERYHRGHVQQAVPLRSSAGGSALEDRVRNLLASEPFSKRSNLANDVLAVLLVGFAVAALFTLVTGDSIHHGAETVLGFFIHHH
jgi:Zn-dependent protease with chaperone function